MLSLQGSYQRSGLLQGLLKNDLFLPGMRLRDVVDIGVISQGLYEVCIKSRTSYKAALVKELEHPQPANIEQPVGLTSWLT